MLVNCEMSKFKTLYFCLYIKIKNNFCKLLPLGYSTNVRERGTHSVLSDNSELLGKLEASLKPDVAILHIEI